MPRLASPTRMSRTQNSGKPCVDSESDRSLYEDGQPTFSRLQNIDHCRKYPLSSNYDVLRKIKCPQVPMKIFCIAIQNCDGKKRVHPVFRPLTLPKC